jgi:hypothetical protein
VTRELQHGLKAAFEKLRSEQAAEPDWHPGSNDMVQNLVHPSMYPFVYGTNVHCGLLSLFFCVKDQS